MSDYRRRRYRFSRHGRSTVPYMRLKYSQRRSCAPRQPFRYSPGDSISLAPIVEAENLLSVYDFMERTAGQAPGPDNVRFSDLGGRERGDAMRALSRTLFEGTYRPGPARFCDIPKPDGGTRTLSLRGILDRVVSRAVATAIAPVIDSEMLDCLFGFRAGRSVHHLLAELEATAVTQDRWVVVCDDVRRAFDHVPIGRAVEASRRHIPDEGVMGLIERLMRGHDGAARQTGIDQGDPASPLALNTLFSEVLDRRLTFACPDTPFLRYADNLIFAGRSVPEGTRALGEARQFLHDVGFALKGADIVDLRRQKSEIQILGFRICRCRDPQTQLRLELGQGAWRSLRQQLVRALEAPFPSWVADGVIRGWLCAYGPTFGDSEKECATLNRIH